jgi:DNA-binding sugar fermentation-stimulating protein
MFLYKFDKVYTATVVKRPSKICKTPYVADITLQDDEANEEHMAHSACLGCCGMVDAGQKVIMTDSTNTKNKCKYRIMLAKTIERGNTNIIGVNPKVAEDLVEIALKYNYISSLKNVHNYVREKKMLNSRFDYFGVDSENKEFVMEVKNVPLADYVDCLAKEKKGLDFSSYDINSKIAYFPDGYRKKQKDTVSPRALKHITELTEIANDPNKNIRTIMCYVVQRWDVSSFQASNVDPIYKTAFKTAQESGVEIIVLQIGWSEDGTAHLISDNLPINN